MSDKYIPINCHLYDQLEEFAVKKSKVQITYLDNYEEKIIEDMIIDFRTKNKEEYLILSNKQEIRLDKVLKIHTI